MKLVAISLSAFLFAVPASLMLTGCAAETSADETVATSQDALSGIAAKLVGTYAWNAELSGDFTDFYALTLKKDGTYTADVEATLINPGIRCIQVPCTLPESGKWSVYKVAGGMAIEFRPTKGKVRVSTAVFENDTLSLTRSEQTTSLVKSTPRSACAAVFCEPQSKCVELVAGQATCVKQTTPAQTTSSCAAVTCHVSSTCVELESGEATCVKQTASACAAVLCGPSTTCVELESGEASCLALKR